MRTVIGHFKDDTLTRITTILIGLTFLTSCDCYQQVSGTVIDLESGRPLQGVTVYNKNKEWSKTTTDTTGHFELSNVSGGFRCPPMTVIADFKNYDKVEIKIPAGGQETIKMERRALQSKTTIQLMQGLWFYDQDSLASLTINNYQWNFNYKGGQANSDDNYLISIVDKLPEFAKETENDSTVNRMRYGVDLERHISILTGFNFWRNFYGELGLAMNQYGRVGNHPAAWAYFISNEIKIDNKILIGPKIGVWAGGGVGGMAIGLNVIYYTDFDQSSLRIRPEIGMGFGRWKVVYGYNIPLTNKKFDGVNKSNIGIALLFGIKKIKTIQQ